MAVNDIDWAELCNNAKDNPAAREKLIELSKFQIARIASHVAGRSLTWENDDELSVSLIAFNEAIDTFDSNAGKSFWGYAGLVIRHRLLDHFRREAGWKKTVTLTEEGDGINQAVLDQEVEMAWQAMRQKEEALDRAEMVINFEKALQEFNISLKDLTKSSPKHQDTRANLLNVAKALTREQELVAKLLNSKQLPIKELMLMTGQSRKVLERGRRYLIALVLILSRPEFSPMKDLLRLERR